jgi:serine/threonine protein phosphatase 1
VEEIFKRFERNAHGRDFAVGDIHGCFTMLEQELEKIGFDERVDRLFSVGDLVDRGPESDNSVYWVMRKPWFHAVRGNHEQMLIDAMNPEFPDAAGHHFINGGQWFYGLPEVEQQCIAMVLDDLPLAIEVDTDRGLVGIVHAEVPLDDWDLFKTLFEGNEDYFTNIATWARKRLSRGYTTRVEGIETVYVGHTYVEDPKTLGNVVYLDTGGCFKEGKLSIVQIN